MSLQFKSKISALKILPAALIIVLVCATPAWAAEHQDDSKHPSHCITNDNQEGVWLAIAVNGQHCFANPPAGVSIDVTQNIIFIYLKGIIKFLTGGAGVLSVGGVVWGGIMYSTARGNPGQVQKAVKIILNSLIALLLFFLLAAIFNYIIPGGLFT